MSDLYALLLGAVAGWLLWRVTLLTSPGFALILLPTLCYALACAWYGWTSVWPLAIMYCGYAFANLGPLWLDRVLAKP